jgi:hypothetical protein
LNTMHAESSPRSAACKIFKHHGDLDL